MAIPVGPKGPKPSSGSTYTASGSSSSGSKTGPKSSGGSKSGGGGGKKKGSGASSDGGYSKYIAQQKAAQAKQDRKETKQAQAQVDKLRNQNKSLEGQANSLLTALGSKGFKRQLAIGLGNINRNAKQKDRLVLEGYRSKLGDLAGSAKDNEKEAADKSYSNATNRNRERLSAVTEAVSNGAGESDILNAQAMALRNWNANQGEVNRSFFDTLRSVNAAKGDLVVDTKTARAEIAQGANDNKGKLWGDYYNQRSETQTQLGNIRGQQSANYSDIKGILGNNETGAHNPKGAKKAGKNAKNSSGQSTAAFNAAAAQTGKAWKNPGIPKAIMNWEGAKDFAGTLNNTNLGKTDGSNGEKPMKKPQGSTLRSWRD